MSIPNKNTRAIFEALRRCALQMRTVNYEALAGEAKIRWARRPMSLHLKYIRDQICIANGLPHLNQLAVNKQSWLPGDSVLPQEYKFPIKAKRTIWRGMVLQVFAYPWENVEFPAIE